MKHKFSGLLGLLALLFGGVAHAESARYIVEFKSADSLPAGVAADIERAGGQLARAIPEIGVAIAVSDDDAFVSRMTRNNKVRSVGVEPYNALPNAEGADSEPVNGHLAPDQFFSTGQLWGVDRVHAPDAWAGGATGNGTVVAVIDTGVAWNHPDLAPNVVFAACVASVPGCNPYPSLSDHGTHVAGTIAAAVGGGALVGVAPDAKIASYNTFEFIPGCGVCTFSSSRWVAQIDAADKGFDVINMSLGSLGGYGGGRSSGLATFVSVEKRVANYVNSRGTLMVAAAGNAGLDLNGWLINLPGGIPQIVNVGATGIRPNPVYEPGISSDVPAFFTNFGAALTVSGPGGDCGLDGGCSPAERPANWVDHLILSAWVVLPTSPFPVDPNCPNTFDCPIGYSWKAGTSMASPHAAGVAALIKGMNPGMSTNQLHSALKRGAENLGDRQLFGHGMVDARSALD